MTDDFKFDPNSTANEGIWRLRDPDDFEPDSYFRKSAGEGVSLVIGRLRDTETTEVQAIRFDKSKFSAQQAAEWWDKHRNQFTRTWSWEDGKMPGFVKNARDEKKWSKAKAAAGSEGGEPKYALANYIFHKGGKKGKLKEQAEHDAKCSMKRGR